MIPSLVCKDDSVRFAIIRPAGFRILAALQGVAFQIGKTLEITSGTDSHAAPDPHALGEAYDVSVADLTVDELNVIVAALARLLPADLFTVLYEMSPTIAVPNGLVADVYVNAEATGCHFHIQRKKDTVYPLA